MATKVQMHFQSGHDVVMSVITEIRGVWPCAQCKILDPREAQTSLSCRAMQVMTASSAQTCMHDAYGLGLGNIAVLMHSDM